MTTFRLRKVLSIILAGTGLTFFGSEPAPATNAACVLNTDYTQSVSGDFVTIKFINPGRICDWSVPSNVGRAEIAIVGGGGSGGYGNQGGGGGGGEVLYRAAAALSPGSALQVTVGAGGASAMSSCVGGNTSFCPGKNGASSSIVFSGATLTARGGGGGGGSTPQAQDIIQRQKHNGASGGSSGGGNRFGISSAPTRSTYPEWTSYANTGGRGAGNTTGNSAPVYGGGGGGGGAGSAGSSSQAASPSASPSAGVGGSAQYLMGMCLAGGGSSLARTSSGNDVYESASACAGIATAPNGSGGASGQNGVANTGGGGGGGVTFPGTVGGSGVIILKYSTVLPTQTISFPSIADRTFNALAFRVPATTDAPGETVTVTSSNTSICTYSGETVTVLSTGICTLTASQAGSTTVQPASSTVRSFQISKGTPALGAFTNISKVYGDSNFNIDTVTASVPGSFALTSLNVSVLSVSGRTASIVGAGTATIRLLFTPTDSANWETAVVTGLVSVSKKNLTVTAPSNTVEFGSPRTVFSNSMSPSYSGFISGETASVLDVAPTCNESESYTSTTSPVFSPYTITCSGGVDNNYLFTYSPGSLTVTQNDMNEYTDAQLISADRNSVAYGDTVTFAQASVGQFAARFTGACVQTSLWTARARSALGTCTGTFTQSNLNYESRTVVINIATTKRQLTISGSSVGDKGYDGTTTAGVVTVGSLGNLHLDETLNLTATATPYSTAIAESGKVTTLNYTITNATGLASNYLAPVSETVTGRVLRATPIFNSWSTKTIPLSSAGESITAPTVISPVSGGTFTYSVQNVAIATIDSGTIVPVSAGTTSLVANYTPTDLTNYESGSISAVVTISKGARTITFGTTSFSKTYGDLPFAVQATPSAGGGDGSISYNATGSACIVDSFSGQVTILRAGNCFISATISTGANYDQVSTSTPVTVSVARKSLTITGTSIASRVYSGDSTPGRLTLGTVSGFILGQTLGVVGSAANLPSSSAATRLVNVTYTLTDSWNASASNYLLADESVTAVIQKKNLTITASNASVNFGSSAPSITPLYVGFSGLEDAADLDTAPTCTSTYTETTVAGSSVVSSCSGAADGNYSFTYASGVVTVNANSRTITLAVSDVTLQYGETATLASTISVGGSDGIVSYLSAQPSLCSISGNVVRAIASVGTCQVAASVGNGVNFSSSTSAYTAITLAKKELTVINSSVSNKIYDGNETATVTSAILSGVVSGENLALIPHARFSSKSVGNSKSVTATMKISGTTAQNYQLIQPTLTTANITVKEVSVSGLSVLNRNFDSSTAATIFGTPMLNGVIGGDSLSLTGYSSGTFASMGPGTNISVATSMSLSGSDASNYQLTQPLLSGDIPLILTNRITLSPVNTKRYGDVPFMINATASSGLPVQVFARGTSCSILGFEVTIVSVGICELSAEQPGDATYLAAEPIVDSFTVLAAEVTLIAESKSIVSGSAIPSNSYRVIGDLAFGESIANVSFRYSSPSYPSSALAPSAIGLYTISINSITLNNGDIGNYRITYVDGTLSIGSTSDKNLASMVVFVPGNPSVDYLYGNFNPSQYSYSVLLPPSASTLRVTIGRSSISTFKSQVRINDSGYRTLKYSSSVGGTADSGDLPVSAEQNSILILITAPDKSTLTYTINIFRELVMRDTTTVTSANVDSIVTERVSEAPTVATNVIMGISFSPTISILPTFDVNTYSYSATVPSTVSSLIVATSFQGSRFVIKVRVNNGGFRQVSNGGRSAPLSLVKGSNQLYIRVESGDGTVAVYTFTVTRL